MMGPGRAMVHGRAFFVLGAGDMRRFLLVTMAAGLMACAHQDYGDAYQSGMASLDVGLTELARAHQAGAELVAAHCRASRPGADKAERIACVSRFGYAPENVERFRAAIEAAGGSYDVLVDVAPVIEQGIEAVRAAKELAR